MIFWVWSLCTIFFIQASAEPIEELRQAIEQKYSYRDLRHVDFNQLFEKFIPRFQATKSPVEFAKVAVELLAHAQDVHITVQVEQTTLPTYQRNIPPNYDMKLIAKQIPDSQSDHRCVSYGHAAKDIGYLVIGQWFPNCEISAQLALDKLIDQKALIIDVRPNSGGQETLAQQFAGRFVSKSMPYALFETRIKDGFSQKEMRVLQPNLERKHFLGKVIVLMGPHNMSSNESFLLMMKAAGATLIGASSFGSSGNPKPHLLSNGVTIYLPSWRAYQLQGSLIEGKGIDPDIVIPWKNGTEQDIILQTAVNRLK